MVVGWLVMQVAATVIPALHLPAGITTAVVVLTLLGFPIAFVIAWAFEMTPEGMKRTESVPSNEHIPQWSRQRFAPFIGASRYWWRRCWSFDYATERSAS